MNKRLLWLIASNMLGENAIVDPSYWQFDQYLTLFRSYDHPLIYKSIKDIIKAVQNKRKQNQINYSFNYKEWKNICNNLVYKYFDRIQYQSKTSEKDEGNKNIPIELRKGLLTPSVLIPNYFCMDEEFSFLHGIILEKIQRNQKKPQIITQNKKIKTILMILQLQDDDGQLIQFSHSKSVKQSNYQNKILHCSLWRRMLRDGIEILGDRYIFAGYSINHLKKHQCVLISDYYFKQLSLAMFRGAFLRKLDQNSIINLGDVMEIMNEFFGQMQDIIHHDDLMIEANDSQSKMENQTDKQESIDINKINNNSFTFIQTEHLETRSQYACLVLLEQGFISQKLIDQIRQIVFKNYESINFSTLIIRDGQYLGVVQLRLNDLHAKLYLNKLMLCRNSPHNQILEPDSVDMIQIQLIDNDYLQIIKYALYKSCNLYLYQLINIALLNRSNLQKPLWKFLSKLLNALFQAHQQFQEQKYAQYNLFEGKNCQPQGFLAQQNFDAESTQDKLIDDCKKVLYMEDSKILKSFEKYLKNQNDIESLTQLRIPISKGAYLVGVYDERLKPQQVFVQYSINNQFSDAEIVSENYIIAFKSYSLNYDAVQRFETVSDKNLIEELRQIYLYEQYLFYLYNLRNVIVFSKDFNYERFPIRDGDYKQCFKVIWEPGLIPIASEKSDYSTLYNEMQFHSELQQDQSDDNDISLGLQSKSILDQSIQSDVNYHLNWLERVRDLLVDSFCLYLGSQNLTDLRKLYTLMSLQLLEVLIQRDFDKNEDTDELQMGNYTFGDINVALNSLNLASLKLLWFGRSQGKIHYFDTKTSRIIQSILAQDNISIEFLINPKIQ